MEAGYLELREGPRAREGTRPPTPPTEEGVYLLGRHTAYIVGEELKAKILEEGDDDGVGWLNIEDFWNAIPEDKRPKDRVPPQGSAAFSRVLFELIGMDREEGLDNPSLGLRLDGFTHTSLTSYRIDSARLGWERTSFLLRQRSAMDVWCMLSENYPYLRGTYRILTRVLHDVEDVEFDQEMVRFVPSKSSQSEVEPDWPQASRTLRD